MFFDLLMQNLPKINRHGINTILILAIVALCISLVSNFLGSAFFLIVIFSLYFFRDPERVTPKNQNGIIFSPADGVITSISKVNIPKKFSLESEGISESTEMTKISIFLNVFDVHVNRSPVNGDIKKIIYSPGKFINVSKEKESEDNESNTLLIKSSENGEMIIVTQIAGLIARRIVCDKKNNEEVNAGERFGIIKFGSRVNIYIPTSYKVLVQEGQRMLGGETIMAFESSERINEFIDLLKLK